MDSGGYWGRARGRRLTRRNLLASAGTAGAAALAAGCGGRKAPRSGAPSTAGGASAEAPRNGGVYSYYLLGNPPTLDPQRTTSYLAQHISGAVYSRLFRFKTAHDPSVAESKELENDLAVSAESPDAVTWTVKLRPDAKFHNVAPLNGRAVDSSDVKASFVRALDPKNPNGGSLDMLSADAIQTPSPDTVVFKLKYPYAAFPGILAVPLYSWILPREALGGGYDPAKQLAGSGPFLFESYTPDVAVTLKKNPDWFEKGRPYLDGVRLAIIPDAAQRLAQFAGGNLDQVEPAANDLDTARRNNAKADLLTGSPNAINPLVGQLGDPSSPWADQRVRRAFSMAMDRTAIGNSVLGGKYQMEALLPLALGKWALRPEDLDSTLGQVYKYDPAAAKRLLQEAGASNLSLKFVYAPNGYAQPYGTLAETINSMLNAVGVKTNLAAVDYNSEYIAGGKGYRAGTFPKDTLVLGAQSGTYTVIDEIMFAYYDSKSGKRFSQLNDPTVDAMVEKARGTLNEADRLKAYQDIQRYLIDKAYYVTGWPWQQAYTMVQPWAHGYTHASSYGFITESYAKLWLTKS